MARMKMIADLEREIADEPCSDWRQKNHHYALKRLYESLQPYIEDDRRDIAKQLNGENNE